ncbi:MAG: pyridoxal phosphate-dependent aminotransferase [Candidatus Omnitrophota bacterium]|nr:pyridoxal phosphate-dependent aminotransferase [Candidatus Omnitrophota bacterium]
MLINTRLAERLKQVTDSSTLAITSKVKKLRAQGQDIVNLAAGEPDFDTPLPIKSAAIEAINSGFTKYTPSSGTPELKNVICEKFKKENSLNYESSQIVVSCGAKHSIFNALFALVNKEDEVLIPSPYWTSYPQMVYLCGGIPRFIKTLAGNNFKIDPKELCRHIGPKTKLLIINSPSNPSGCVYTAKELSEIAVICVKKKIFVLSDEIYEKLIFDNLKNISIAGLNSDIYDLAITVNGVSKSYSMTGWRIGYLGAPPDIAGAISRLQDHTTSNPNSIAQKAAIAALKIGDGYHKQVCAEFQKRRDFCVSRLNKMRNLVCTPPQGAFYIFCDISKTGLDALTFSKRLLDQALVGLIPGDAFGMDTHIRLSFAAPCEQLEKGMDRIEQWLKKQ